MCAIFTYYNFCVKVRVKTLWELKSSSFINAQHIDFGKFSRKCFIYQCTKHKILESFSQKCFIYQCGKHCFSSVFNEKNYIFTTYNHFFANFLQFSKKYPPKEFALEEIWQPFLPLFFSKRPCCHFLWSKFCRNFSFKKRQYWKFDFFKNAFFYNIPSMSKKKIRYNKGYSKQSSDFQEPNRKS